MQQKKALYSFLIFGLSSSIYANPISISGQNDFRTLIDSLNQKSPSRHLDNWLDLNISQSKISIDLGFEIHTPPFPGSFSPSDTLGIQFRSIQYETQELTLELGHFYATLGNGIVLKSYEDREMGWNTNIDGVRFSHSSSLVEASFWGGKMRDTFGRRYELIQGGSTKAHLSSYFKPGFNTVVTQIDDISHHWGSFTSDFYFSWMDLKLELASFDFWDGVHNWKKQSASYLNTNIFLSSYALFIEAKYYKDFAISQNNLEYNAPPPVTQVHFFSLFQDNNPVDFRGNDEKGFLIEASGELFSDLFSSFSYSQTQSINHSQVLFEEVYTQLEYPIKKASTLTGFGYQKDFNGYSLQAGSHLTIPLSSHSFSLSFAHQHKTINRSFLIPREYFLQSYELGYSWPQFTTSIISTLSSEPNILDSNKLISHYWIGGQVDFKLADSHSLSLFAGTRKEGKICAGGVCVKKPELVGAELTIKSNF